MLLVAKVEGGGRREWGKVRFQKELLTNGDWRNFGSKPAKGKKKLRAKRPVQEVLNSMEWYKPKKGRVVYKAFAVRRGLRNKTCRTKAA